MAKGLDELTREQLVELLEITAKDTIALDGTWFQSLEAEQGMDTAMEHDRAAWRRFVPSEARRLKKLLALPDACGLEGLATALPSAARRWPMSGRSCGRKTARFCSASPTAAYRTPAPARAWASTRAKAWASWSTPASPPPWTTASSAPASAAFPTQPTTPATAPGSSGWRDSR